MTSQTSKTLASTMTALLLAVGLSAGLPVSTPAADADCSSSGCHQALGRVERRVSTDDDGADGEWGDSKTHLHGPLAEGLCVSCHFGHAADQRPSRVVRGNFPASLYATYSRSSYSACFDSCHSAALVEEVRTEAATRFRNGDDNLHYRHVAKLRRGRSCRLCHDPHEGRNQALIREYMPFGQQRLTLKFEASDSGGKCTTSCHISVEYDRDEAILSPMRVAEHSEYRGSP